MAFPRCPCNALIADAHQDSGNYGPDHPDTLTTHANLAHWPGEAKSTDIEAS
jgi:hypothetical protein